MVELRRIVRFSPAPLSHAPPSPNAYAGSPAMEGLGAHYELEVACRGQLDPRTGYLVDIKAIDRAVRAGAVPIISQAFSRSTDTQPGELLPAILAAIAQKLPNLLSGVVWSLSPYYRLEMDTRDTRTVLIRQRFDFAAAHRLHSPDLSDEENRALFGKCNHPSGHGHNYQVEPCVAVTLDANGRQSFTLRHLEALTSRVIIDRFDHKHLNLDVPEFRQPGGVNPTVENIARVSFEALAPHIASSGATLRSITVWETDRTSCTFPAGVSAP